MRLTNFIRVVAFAAGAATATIAQAADISGAGATFPFPIYAKWADSYKKDTGNGLNYQSIGSGAGIKQIKARTVTFGATDAPLEPKELDKAGLAQFPMVMGGIVAVVNLPGVKPGDIVIDGPTLAQIYLGKITNWNDPALKATNPAILVEGEIGDIGTGSEIHEEAPDLSKGLTSPAEAKQFVEATGVDILAPAVGNMHGMLKSMVHGQTRKRLDIQRIAQIKSAAQVPLTLHGGSGTDDEDLRKAIVAGINIIHINTELRVAWRRGLEEGLAKQPHEVVPYKILPFAVESVKKVARSRLNLFNGDK